LERELDTNICVSPFARENPGSFPIAVPTLGRVSPLLFIEANWPPETEPFGFWYSTEVQVVRLNCLLERILKQSTLLRRHFSKEGHELIGQNIVNLTADWERVEVLTLY
jgi:hypothetical protein